MLSLENALYNCTTTSGLNQIFSHDVKVTIDTAWGTDQIRVLGYDGSVSSQFFAERVRMMYHTHFVPRRQGDGRDQLANTINAKVFFPLGDKVKKLDETSRCSLSSVTLLYKIRNVWSVDPSFSGNYLTQSQELCIRAIKEDYTS